MDHRQPQKRRPNVRLIVTLREPGREAIEQLLFERTLVIESDYSNVPLGKAIKLRSNEMVCPQLDSVL